MKTFITALLALPQRAHILILMTIVFIIISIVNTSCGPCCNTLSDGDVFSSKNNGACNCTVNNKEFKHIQHNRVHATCIDSEGIRVQRVFYSYDAYNNRCVED